MRSPPSRLCVQAVTKAGYDAILSAPWYLNLGCYATQVGAAAGGGGAHACRLSCVLREVWGPMSGSLKAGGQVRRQQPAMRAGCTDGASSAARKQEQRTAALAGCIALQDWQKYYTADPHDFKGSMEQVGGEVEGQGAWQGEQRKRRVVRGSRMRTAGWAARSKHQLLRLRVHTCQCGSRAAVAPVQLAVAAFTPVPPGRLCRSQRSGRPPP